MKEAPRQHRRPVVRLYPVFGSRFPVGRAGRVGRGLLLGLAMLPAMVGWALDAPGLRCASVNVAGDVTLTWTVPPDPAGEFDAYEIFHANSAAGPFVPLATINVYGQTSYYHAGAGALGGARYYYMTSVTNGMPPVVSVPGDTVATLFLQVFQSAPLGSANLSWNAPALAPTAGPEFTIWMEWPVGTWTLVDQVGITTFAYQHVISICEDSLTFRVGVTDAAGCVSFSNPMGDVFADATPPSMPVIVAAGVDTASGLSTISWVPSPEADTDGYIIVWVTPSGGVVIDTVFGQASDTYTWLLSQPGAGPESFTVAAFDTCEVGEPPSPNTSATRSPHTTVHTVAQYDRCGAEVHLTWTHYVGWEIASYQVLVQLDGGGWVALANVPAGTTSYDHEVDPDRAYCYVVKAVAASGALASLSNKVCVLSDYPSVPSFNYLRSVTVAADDVIIITDSVDASAHAAGYVLQRSDNGGPYASIAEAPGGSGPVIVFTDPDVTPADVGYRYRVQVLDSCGNHAVTSNVGGNIVLRATPLLSGHDRLEWNGYAAWAGLVDGFVLERSVDGMPLAELLQLPPQPWSYLDDVGLLTMADGRFCYRIRAVEAGNPSGINAISESNIACAVQEEMVYIPNAFVVGGANPLFIPVLAYVDVSNYEFTIINRWGQAIWTTNDRNKAWDGRSEGVPAPVGVYAYYCAFNNGAGRQVEKRGTVTLLTAD